MTTTRFWRVTPVLAAGLWVILYTGLTTETIPVFWPPAIWAILVTWFGFATKHPARLAALILLAVPSALTVYITCFVAWSLAR
jgi:hypothetical protein